MAFKHKKKWPKLSKEVVKKDIKRTSHLEDTFQFQLNALNITCETEYKFSRDAIGNPKTGIRAALKEAGLKDWLKSLPITARK